MTSPQEAQALAHEIVEWLNAKGTEPDNAVPALIAVGVKLAIAERGASPRLYDTLIALVRAVYEDEQRKPN